MDTTSNRDIPNTNGDEISLKEIIVKTRKWYRFVLSRWIVVLTVSIVVSSIVFYYAYSSKPLYTAECTFVMEGQGAGGSLGQYAGLASLVGIDLGSGGGGIFHGENIMELYKSRSMIQKTLLSYGVFDGREQLLIDRYIQHNSLRSKWSSDAYLKDIAFDVPSDRFLLKHDSILSIIVDDINRNYLKVSKPDMKLSIISVEVTSLDEPFAKEFADQIVSNVNDFYIHTKTKKSVENLLILQKQADSVRQVLNASMGSAAAAIDANPNANAALQMLKVPNQRKQIDVQASSNIYVELVKNLTIARLSLRQETPLIQIIDPPKYPLNFYKPSTLKYALASFTLCVFVMSCTLIVAEIIKNNS